MTLVAFLASLVLVGAVMGWMSPLLVGVFAVSLVLLYLTRPSSR